MAVQEFSHLREQKGGKEGGDSISVGERCLAIGLHPIDGKKGGHLLTDGIEIKADQVRLARPSANHGKACNSKNNPAIEKSAIDYVEERRSK